MSAERLVAVALLTCVAAAGLYTFAIPQSDADPAGNAPNAVVTNVAIAAPMSPLGAQREVDEEVDPVPSSREARKLVDACSGSLRRRGMSTSEGSEAIKVCTCIANMLDARIGDSDDAMKLAGLYFDPLFDPYRKNAEMPDRFIKKAKRYKHENRKVFKAMNKAVKSGCRVRSKLGIQPGYISPSFIYPRKK